MGWPPPRNLAVYHAAPVLTQGPDSLERKMELFREIQRIQKWGWPAWLWSCLSNSHHRMRRLLASVGSGRGAIEGGGKLNG